MSRSARRLISIVIPILLGAAAAFYTQLSLWLSMKEGLIAFLGLITASLMQVMPMTANFIQSDKLTPVNARRLVESLTKQQYYWIGLLAATISTLVVIIASAAISPYLSELYFNWHGLMPESAFSFLIASLMSFVLIKTMGLFEGMLSLHNLRSELVLEAAEKAAKKKKDDIQARAGILTTQLPDGYGKIVDHPQA
jgi:hypothetical protein